MNHIHKSIWNEQTQTFVAVSELTRARGKKSSAGGQLIAAVALAGISGLAGAGSLDGGNNFALERAIAYGQGAIASSDGSSAVGSASQATQADASAFGHQSIASGTNSTALGNQVEAAGDGSIAIQGNSDAVLAVDAASARAIAIGQNSVVTQSTSAVALGDGARASNGSNDSVAIGRLSNVTGSAAGIAIGSDANVNAGAAESIAFGKAASVRSTTGGNAIAIGSFATATATQATALGAFSQAAQAAIAAGAYANASGSGSVAVGNRTTATGTNSIVLGNQVEAAGPGSIAIQGNASGLLAVDAASADAVAIGARSTVRQGNSSIAIGADASIAAGSSTSIAIGKNARISNSDGTDAIAVGHGAAATGGQAVIFGSYSQAALAAVAVGGFAKATGQHSVAVGNDATASTQGATAVGRFARANGANSTVIGSFSTDNAVANTTLLGAGTSATTGATNSVAIGDASTVARANAVSIGNATTTRQMVNLSAGTASTDAVNVSQLTGALNALGGGAGVNPVTGVVTAPSYTVGGTTVNNVGAALSNLDARTSQNTTNISNLVTGQVPDAVKYDSATHDTVTLGNAGTPVAVKNVAAGTAATDAVNKGQLDGVQSTLTTTVNNLGSQVADTVKYDSAAHNSVTLGTAGTPVAVKNIAAGTAATDAVNKSQLDGVQSTLTTTVNNLGSQMADAVKYDSAAHNSVTLGTAGTPVAVKNVAAATAATDAVNKAQLDGVQSTLTSSIGTVDTKVGTLGTSTATALGGGATANPDGSITPPSYSVGGTTVRSVGAAISSLDGRTTQNTSDIGNINTALGSLSGQMADAVKYDSPAHDSVTLGATGTPVAVKNVAAGAAATDAVNKGQLDGVQSTLTTSIGAVDTKVGAVDTKVGTLGTSTAAALGGGATANPDGSITPPSYSVGGTTVRNVGAAITNLDGRTTQNTGDIANISTTVNNLGGQVADSVKYDSAAHNSVTLGAAGTPVSVKNVAAGTVATDAVNKSQLDGVQSTLTTTVNNLAGQVTDAVKYDSAVHDSVTLGNSGTPVAVKNVAAGTAASDAANKGQLDGVQSTLTSSIGTVDTKVGTLGTSTATALGGGATANPDGSITPPSYSVGGTTVRNVGAAITNLDGRTTQNTSDIGNINTTLGTLGGQMADTVKYDSPAHNSVTLGTTGTPVAVKNIAAGAAATDAVNKGQLDGVQSTLTTTVNNLAGQVTDAVKYDSAAHDSVTLGATGTPVAVKNVAAGAAATDAANKGQLDGVQSTLTTSIGTVDTKVGTLGTSTATALGGGATANPDGSISPPSYTVGGTTVRNVGAAITNLDGRTTQNTGDIANISTTVNNLSGQVTDTVKYDTAAHNSVTLGNTGTAVAVKNVAAGAAATDAVNKGQLDGVQSTLTTSIGTVDTKVGTLGTSTAAALGGGATANPDGSITPPSYSVGGSTVASVGAAITNLDGRTTQNTGDIANISTTVNNLSGQVTDTVKYDSAAHNSVTLGTTGTPVAVKNVAAATAATDAVNKAQLDGVQSTLTTSIGTVDTKVGTLGTSTAAALGGGATANPDGSITPPSYSVGGTTVRNVGAAITNLDGRTTQNTSDIGNINTTLGTLGGQMADTVKYDSPAHNSVTLGTTGTPVAVKNVAAGAAATDAVNKSQLDGVQSTLTTTVNNLAGQVTDAVKYDSAAHNSVTLGNAGTAVAVKNVAAGAAATDAVNKAQLDTTQATLSTAIGTVDTKVSTLGTSTASALGGGATANPDGSITPPSYSVGGGTVASVGAAITNLDGRTTRNTGDIGNINTTLGSLNGQMADAVKYDSAAHNTVTLGATGTPVAVKNIAAGAAATDAVNKAQLDTTQSTLTTSIGAVDTKVGTVDTKVSTLSTSTAAALGGGATANPDGSITPPSYSVGGGTVASVGAAITNLDGRTTRNTSDIGNINTTLGGLNGQMADAVKYDSPAHNSVTLGTTGTPVAVKNIAAGAAATDAVNKAQLDTTQSTLSTSIGAVDTKVGTLGTSTAAALGGGATANPDGSITPPSYSVGGGTVASVGAAITNLDGRTTRNTSDIGNINTTLGTLGGQMADTVKYDSPAHNSVTLGAVGTPVSVKNVATGAAATDAVNKSQLDGVQSTLTTTVNNLAGQVTDAVKYDSAAHNSVTLGNAGTAVAVKNVAAGAAVTDAVNKGQLDSLQSAFTTAVGAVDTRVGNLGTSTAAALGGGATANPNGSISPPSYVVGGSSVSNVGAALSNLDTRTTQNTNNIANLVLTGQVMDAVKYDSLAHTSVTLGAVGTPVTMRNVAAGTATTDAVNKGQLDGVQSTVTTTVNNLSGQMADAVKYDSAAHNSVTLGTAGTPVAVKNIAAGSTATDAVNKGQLDSVQSTLTTSIGTVDTKVSTLGTSTATALGGGATANPDGSITPPSYSVGGGTVTSVGAAITNIDGRTTRNTSDISTLNTTISNLSGQAADAVKYDSPAHNTVTLGAAGTPVIVRNIAAGTAATDAVNKSQLDGVQSTVTTTVNNLSGQMADAVKYDSAAHNSVTLGTAGTPVAVKNIAAGTAATDAANKGQLDSVQSTLTTSIGTVDTKVSTLGTSTATALGGGATANPDGSITPPSYSVGGGTVTSVGAAITNIDGRTTRNTSDISTLNTTISNLSGQAADAVKYDSPARGSVTLGNAGTPVAIRNVAAGLIGLGSTDAVNGAQLHAMSDSFATALGGGAAVRPDGTVGAPAFSVGGVTYNSVGGALSGLGSRMASIDNRVTTVEGSVTNVTNQINNGSGMIKQDVATRSINIGKDSDGGIVNVAGAGGARVVAGVQAGAVSATSTDAVNGSQLNATNVRVTSIEQSFDLKLSRATGSGYVQVDGKGDGSDKAAVTAGTGAVAIGSNANASASNSVAIGANAVASRGNTVSIGSAGNERILANVADAVENTDAINKRTMEQAIQSATNQTVQQVSHQISDIRSMVGDVGRKAFAGVAGTAALSMIPDVDSGKNLAIGVGTAQYQGYVASAVGISARINDRLKIKTGASISASGNVYGAGASYQW